MRGGRWLYLGALAVTLAIAGLWQPVMRARADRAADSPEFRVDPFWPKPLPAPVGNDGAAHRWVTGEVAGSCIDANDNLYTFNRGWEVGLTFNGVLQGNQSGAIVGQDASASSIPSPPIVAYDSDGNTVAGFGNPALIQPPAPDYGFAQYLPHGAHGCHVDYQGNLWVGGNGDGVVQKYNPQLAAAQGPAAKWVLQIGVKGKCDGTQTTPNPYSSCGEANSHNMSHDLLNEPPDIAVDPGRDPQTGERGSVYIADGYGNHRIVVFSAAGKYLRQWGMSCGHNGQDCPGETFGATGGGHPHCIEIGKDGYVYACDRPNSRILVFDRSCGRPSSAADPQPLCTPRRVININGFAPGATTKAILLAGTRACDIDFWPKSTQSVIVNVDLGNDNTWLIHKATGLVFGALGRCGIAPCPGHNAGEFAFGHTTSVDSKGNIYVAETITGRRIQKFVRGEED